MSRFQRVYTDEQRSAIQQAWGDRSIRPARAIVALAAEGALTHNGDVIPAFRVTAASVNDIGRRYLRARERHARRLAAESSPRDAIELVRRRLNVAIDEQLLHVERLQAAGKHDRISPETLRQIARAAREVAALPGPNGEPAPAKRAPGDRDNDAGRTPDGKTRGGLAGSILAAHSGRPISTPAQSDPLPTESTPETGGAHERINVPAEQAAELDSEDPGVYARARIAALGARVSSVRPA